MTNGLRSIGGRVLVVAALTLSLAACGQHPGGAGFNPLSWLGKKNASQQADSASWTPYNEPSEQAFTATTPQGWKVESGIARVNAAMAKPWLTTTSPDGETALYVDDPNIPRLFTSGDDAPGAIQGQIVQGPIGPMTVMSYKTGAEFAAAYGAQKLATMCTDVQLLTTQPRPDIVQQARAKLNEPSAELDAGMAAFSCSANGRPYESGIYMITRHLPGGLWTVEMLAFRAPKGQGGDAEKLLLKLYPSIHLTPQWMAKMDQAVQQALAQRTN